MIATSPAPLVLDGPLVQVPGAGGDPGCLGVTTADGTSVVQPRTTAFSWRVTLADDGSLDPSRSEIVRGGDPDGGDYVAHTGTSVRPTGGWTSYDAPGMCGATRVFQFDSVG